MRQICANPVLANGNDLKGCEFLAGADGYLKGCVDSCRGYSSLGEAKVQCVKQKDCTGITRVPWLDINEQYQLRSGSAILPSIDGQVTYLLKGCETNLRSQSLDTSSDRENSKPVNSQTSTHSEAQLKSPHYVNEINFWVPPPDYEANYHKFGTFVNGKPTVFVGIASYRDPMCHLTLERVFTWAKHPERVYVGVVEQNAEVDEPCTPVCEEGTEKLSCKFADHIRIMKVNARDAKGP